ncbi:hypothetical protein GGU11DRAFT_747654 [Lentinula aff. detonsa]|nr:hypothetical protein GGU11DRAFT_747654 [Lentinula aff. detonsa]
MSFKLFGITSDHNSTSVPTSPPPRTWLIHHLKSPEICKFIVDYLLVIQIVSYNVPPNKDGSPLARRVSISSLSMARAKSQRTSETSQKLVVLPSAPQMKPIPGEDEDVFGYETDAGILAQDEAFGFVPQEGTHRHPRSTRPPDSLLNASFTKPNSSECLSSIHTPPVQTTTRLGRISRPAERLDPII